MYLPRAVLGLLRPEPLLLRLDAPTLRLPQVDVYLLLVADPDPALLEVLPEAVRRLPRELRDVVVLRYFTGLTLAETAQALRIPPGTVSTRQRRALSLLRLELREEE
mgnify:CR=1 FL=1